MGVTSDSEISSLSGFLSVYRSYIDSTSCDEVIPLPDKSEMKQKVLHFYEHRINRYRERLSAMYPDNGCTDTTKFSHICTTSMMDVLSYMDVSSQLELKKVNRYFLKLVKIAQTDVNLNVMDGWIDAIHISTFLKRLVLAGEPKEGDLIEFTTLLQNDGFLQLTTLELYLLGEWVVLDILNAIATRVNREYALGLLSEDFRLNLVVQEKEFSLYFATHFAALVNSSLYLVLSNLSFISSFEGSIPILLRETHLSRCLYLTEIYMNGIPLGWDGIMALCMSLWPSDQSCPHSVPVLSRLFLGDTLLKDSCVLRIATAVKEGLLTSLEYLDLSRNSISAHSATHLVHFLNSFLCPCLRYVKLSENPQLSNGCLAAWFRGLAQGTCPCLRVLELNDCGLLPCDFTALGEFCLTDYAAHIIVLDLGNNKPGDAILDFLAALRRSPCTTLETLNLEGARLCGMDHSNQSHQSHQSHNSSQLVELAQWLRSDKAARLKRLILRRTQLTGEALCELLDALQSSAIHHLDLLDLCGNGIHNLDRDAWEALIACPTPALHIDMLSLARNPYSNEDFFLIVQWLQHHVEGCRLKEMSFEDNAITTTGVAAFFRIFPQEVEGRLDSLSIVSTSIRMIGVALHQWLLSPASTHLRSLQMVNCNLSKKDVAYLVDAFRQSDFCQKLELLRLSGNHDIDDMFICSLLDTLGMGRMPCLHKLDLSYTGITKRGAYHFVSFFQNASSYSLRSLNLSYADIPPSCEKRILSEFCRVFKGHCVI